MSHRGPGCAARAASYAALVVLFGGCAVVRGEGIARPASRATPSPDARMLAWARLGTEAAARASVACAHYSRQAFYAVQAGRFEPELHGPCAAPAEAALHARVADLALLAASRAAANDSRAEAAVRGALEREAPASGTPAYVREALRGLDGVPPERSEVVGCARAARDVVDHLEALAVRARAAALSACPADGALPSPASSPYLVPASRCGERSVAQLHATVAHVLLLAASRGVSAASNEDLASVHDWFGAAEQRGELAMPDYAARMLHVRAEMDGVDRCDASAELLDSRWRDDAERRRVPGTGLALEVPRTSTLAAGSVELGGALGVQVTVTDEPAQRVLARLDPSHAARPIGTGALGRWVLRTGAPDGRGRGVIVVADVGDATAVLEASHFVPTDAALWDRVAALMVSVERVAETPPWVAEDLGFVVERPGPPFVSFVPGGIRFSTEPVGSERSRTEFAAGLHGGTAMPTERAMFCDPERLFGLSHGGSARILARAERRVAGAVGCELAVVRDAGGVERFEYAAFGFLANGRAEIHVSAVLHGGASEGGRALLDRARAWTDAFALAPARERSVRTTPAARSLG